MKILMKYAMKCLFFCWSKSRALWHVLLIANQKLASYALFLLWLCTVWCFILISLGLWIAATYLCFRNLGKYLARSRTKKPLLLAVSKSVLKSRPRVNDLSEVISKCFYLILRLKMYVSMVISRSYHSSRPNVSLMLHIPSRIVQSESGFGIQCCEPDSGLLCSARVPFVASSTVWSGEPCCHAQTRCYHFVSIVITNVLVNPDGKM